MKLFLFGATGATGRHVVRQALDRGHDVTAFVRDPERLGFDHDRLRPVAGNALDAAAVRAAVRGHEAVVFAIGDTNPLKTSTLVSDATRTAVDALAEAGGGRFVAISVLGTGNSAGEGTPLYDLVLRHTVLRGAIADRERQEAVLRAAPPEVEWVAVRAPLLTDGPPRFAPVVLADGEPGVVAEIPRVDLAAYMLDQLAPGVPVRRAVAVGYPPS